ncbi:MAG: Lrp/AsnC family transcriptional regulator [Mycobacterium sp.]
MVKLDGIDARILLALCDTPRASAVQLAASVKLARNTVQSRITRWRAENALAPIDRCVAPRQLGYPLRAFVSAVVDQHKLEPAIKCLGAIPEVAEVVGISGTADLHIDVNTTDTDDLYRVAGLILAVPGVERTVVSVVVRPAIPYRTRPLLERIAGVR